jgi:hypothetical protein
VRLDDIADEWHCPEPRSFQQPYDLPPPGSRPHDLRLETTSSIGKAQSAPHPPSTGAYKQYSGWWSLAPAGGATDPVWNQMLSACCTLNSWRRKDYQMLKPKHKLGNKYVPRMWHPNTPVLSHFCHKSFGSNLLVVVVVAVKSFEGLDVHLDAASETLDHMSLQSLQSAHIKSRKSRLEPGSQIFSPWKIGIVQVKVPRKHTPKIIHLTLNSGG